ncbi:MAG: 50S ribosomal protein L24 [Lachnospiraceae bacterium]|jgi:large subunit ribosomal protein L24|nr:50S ribosomal protein L24 [Lachnospiraceae bacterium]
MATSKIKKDDLVQVITGKDKGKNGKVLSVDVKNHKVLVEGVNMVSKHTKPNMANQQGGIIEKEAPIDISNVMYVHKGKPVRIGFEGEKKNKVRVAKVNGKLEKID